MPRQSKRTRRLVARLRQSLARRRKACRKYLRLEPLEPRALLAVTQVEFVSGEIQIEGTDLADRVVVEQISPTELEITTITAGQPSFYRLPSNEVTAIAFAGYDGDDTFVNFTSIPSYVDAGTGDDYVFGGAGSDKLIGGAGEDRLIGSTGNDQIQGGDDDDWITAGDGADFASGGEGNDRIEGGDGADLIYGDAGDDNLFGGLGNDTIRGHDGHDRIYGNEGDDLITGHAGDDHLLGGSGNDRLDGGDDNDWITAGDGADFASGGEGNDRIEGGDGDDLIYGDAGDDNLFGGLGNDTIRGHDGRDRVYGNEGDDLITGHAGNDHLLGGSGNDRIEGGDDSDWILGGAGSDLLSGDDGDDRIEGDDGNDVIYGDAGNDILIGGFGNDTIRGHAGHDVLHGNEGDDILTGHDGEDKLYGGDGDDWLEGGADDDAVYGDGGADFASGAEGNDRVEGGDGNDLIYGEAGDDTLIGGFGNDTIRGHEGNDTLYGNEGNDLITGHDGDDQLLGGDGSDRLRGGVGNDSIFGHGGADHAYGDEGNDRIEGGDGNDWLDGGAGNDVLLGQLGNDQLFGQDGSDYLDGDEGDDTLDGGLGDDTLHGRAGSDFLSGEQGDDHLYAGADDDFVYGGEGQDRIEGGDGNDWLVGGAGNDVLLGQLGNDQLFGQDGSDYLDGDEGDDTLDGGLGDDTLYGRAGSDVLSGEQGDDHLYAGADDDFVYGGEGQDRIEGGDGNDLINGGAGNDVLLGQLGNDQLFGQDGSDYLDGDEGDDTLDGGLGDDTLYGRAGSDVLAGEQGDDFLYAGADDDFVYGGEGQDRIEGGDGNDWLEGGAGNDDLLGQLGNDQLLGQDGSDYLYGDEGDDTLDGGAGDDFLQAGAGDDVVLGSQGDDLIEGSDGNDALVGGDGVDRILGGLGDDVLVGGMEADTLIGESGQDILVGGATIYDDDPDALRTILQQWSSGLSFEARVALLSQHDVENSLALLPLVTLIDDAVSDTLWGHGDTDWAVLTSHNSNYSPIGPQHGQHSHVVTEPLVVEGFALIDSIDALPDINSNDRVTSILPHATEPVKAAEHLQMFELVKYADVTHTAIASGNWSDPSIWQDGAIPSTDARVLIPMGVQVTVDQVLQTEVFSIRVDGTLSFDPNQDTELRVDTLFVGHMGRFEMGTQAVPVQAGVESRLVITDNGEIDRNYDPFGVSRGLISHGAVEMYGQAKTSFTSVEGSLAAGSRFISLSEVPTNWSVGDRVVIAGTSSLENQDEERVILGIVGSVIEVAPLDHAHNSPSSATPFHIANLTRNVVIESEGDAVDRRGHVMFMHNRDVDVNNVGFYKLGRTDKTVSINDSVVDEDWNLVSGTGTNPRARYAVHFHRNGAIESGTPSTVRGSVVDDSVGWGYVNHSSYVDITDSVAYDVIGAGFVTETGEEVGEFSNNLAIHLPGAGTGLDTNLRAYVQDFAHGGEGFWLQGPGVTVTDNIVAGSAGGAFTYFARGLREFGYLTEFASVNLLDPSIAEGAATISIQDVAPRPFENNVAYASVAGLQTRYVLYHSTNSQEAVFADSILWNNETGIYAPYAHNITFDGIVVMHDDSALHGFGFRNNDVTRNTTFKNVSISGYDIGIWVNRRGFTHVESGQLSNVRNIRVTAALDLGREVIVGEEVILLEYPFEFLAGLNS